MARICINKKYVLMFIVAFILFPPYIMERVSTLMDMSQRVVQIVCIICLAIGVIKSGNIKLTKKHVFWLIFWMYGLVLTYVLYPKGVYSYIVTVVIKTLMPILLCIYLSKKKDIFNIFLECMIFYSLLLTSFNFICMIIFPNGIIRSDMGASQERANWLFGSKNNIVYPMIVVCIFLFIGYMQTKKKRYIIGLILSVFEMIFSGSEGIEAFGGSSTGIIILIVLFCFILFYKNRTIIYIYKSLSPFSIMLFFMIVSIVVISFTLSDNMVLNDLFQLFGKDNTVSGRDRVWEILIYRISRSSAVGYGYMPKTEKIVGSLSSSYNFFLDCIYRYGIIGQVILFIIMSSYGNKKDDKTQDRVAYMMLVGFFCMFIGGIVNTIKWDYLVLMLEMYQLQKENSKFVGSGVEENAKLKSA